MSPAPDPAAARYQGEAGRHYHESKRALPAQAYDWVARARAELFQPHICATNTVLEIGVGYGWNLAQLRCQRRIGVDLAETLRAEVTAHGIEFLTDTKPLPVALADTVICHHMLEHAAEPTSVLTEIHRLLRPEGSLLLAVPYEKERRYRHYQRDEPNHHLYSWNVQTLSALVETCGFRVEQAGLRTYGQDRFAAQLAVKLNLGESGFHIIRKLARVIRGQQEVCLVARPVK